MLTKGPSCHTPGTTGYGLWQKGGVCFVGIAPGRDEYLRSGTPLTGPSGQLLDAVLEAVGWPREQTYATNLLCWWKDKPELEDILGCWDRLNEELARLQPKLIIPLGEIVTDFLLGNVPISLFDHSPADWNTYAWRQINANESKWIEGEEYFGFTSRRGRTSWSSYYNAYVCPTYHPAAALRGYGSIISDIVKSLSKIKLVQDQFDNEGLESKYRYTVIEDITAGNSLLSSLPRGTVSVVSLDIETNYGRPDIDWFTEDLLCLSITWGWNDTVVIPGSIAKLLDWTLAEGVNWIGQNFIFDVGGIKRWIGADLSIAEDTMLQSYALDERPGHHDLETLGGEWCAAPMWKSALAKYTVTRTIEEFDESRGRTVKKRRKFREVPDAALYRYNAGDTTYTFRSYKRQSVAVREDGMEGVYKTLLIPAANAFKEIQYRGLYIDQQRQSELMIEWCQLWLDQEEELNSITHEVDPELKEEIRLNYRSHQQMVKFVYDTLKAPKQYAKQSTKGAGDWDAPKLTVNKDAMYELRGVHPFFNLYHEWRQTDHQLQVSEGISQRIKVDDMLHATPQIHGTETGRLSYKDPNLQNMSQAWIVGDNLARIREIFAPRNPDTHFIAEADYRQIEIWMALQWSHDPAIAEGLATGDFHRFTAMSMFNKKWDEVTKGERYWAKPVTFGRFYERGAADMKRGRGFEEQTIAELEEWVQRWSIRYSRYVEWTRELKQQAINEGTIISPWGRKRRYYLVIGEEAHHQLRSALNFCMQSTAHDYTLSSLIILQRRLAEEFDSYILTENHDSLLLEISIKHAEGAIQLITETMESVRPNLDWPTLKVDWKSGPNWGLAHEACSNCNRLYPFTSLPQEVEVSPTVKKLMCKTCYDSTRRAAV